MKRFCGIALICWLALSCYAQQGSQQDTSAAGTSEYKTKLPFGAGYRHSAYGPRAKPGPEYWVSVGKDIASKFDNAVPKTIWIVGRLRGKGVYLDFPVETNEPLIRHSEKDENEEILNEFDKNGYKIWLQVESGNAPVDELIHLVLARYKHHKCVMGFGVDVEWYDSPERPEGRKVTDEVAKKWVSIVRSYNPEYRLFLKHWTIEKMPDTERTGIVFIDDSQGFRNMEQMVNEFAEWGKAFAPAQVGFQFGYPKDGGWWRQFKDPAKVLGDAILAKTPNTVGLYWVDFTVIEVFPPENYKK